MRHGPRPFILLSVALLAVLLAACSDSSDPTSTPLPPTATASDAPQAAQQGAEPGSPIVSSIQNFTLQDHTVAVGTKLRWANLDRAPHTVTSGVPDATTGVWDSGTITPGGTFNFTFDEPGTFAYFCSIHNNMRATITVTGSAASASAAGASPVTALTALGPAGTWTRQFGTGANDYTRGVAVDSQGRVYAAGWTSGLLMGDQYLGGESDAILRLFDSEGNVLGTIQFGSQGADLVRAVRVDGKGNHYIAGWTEGEFNGEINLGRGDAFVSKRDTDGQDVWTRQWGTELYDLVQDMYVDADGNSFLVGWTKGAFPGYTNLGSGDSMLRKYDSDGVEVWTRQFGTDKDEFLRGVVVDGAGNVVVAGWTEGSFPGQTSSGLADTFVRKFDASGAELWTRQFGSDQFDFGQTLTVDNEGSIYVGGWTNGELPGQINVGGGDAFIRKYDASGNEVWTWQFGTTAFDEVSGLLADAGDVLYASGLTAGALGEHTNSGAQDAFVLSFDKSGRQLGVVQYGSNGDDTAHSMALDDEGNLYVGGWTGGALPGQSRSGVNDAYVLRMSATLDTALVELDVPGRIWTRQFGTHTNDFAGDAWVDGAGNVTVAGWSSDAFPNQRFEGGEYDGFLRKYAEDGSELWTRQFGTNQLDLASGVTADSAGNLYVVGQVGGDISDETNSGDRDAFVRKYDPDGTELWTRLLGSAGVDVGSAITIDGADNLYVAGWAEGSLPSQRLVGRGDAFVARYDGQGNLLWVRQFGTDGADEVLGVQADRAGNVYVAGYVTGALPGQTDQGGRDGFVRGYDPDGTELWTRQFGTSADDLVLALAIDRAGNVYLVGNAGAALPGQSGSGATDAFVRRYDSSGNEVWTRQFGTEGADQGLGVQLDPSENLHVVGITEGALPGFTKTGGTFDAFVRKYDPDGNEIATRQISTLGSDVAFGTAVDGEGFVYVVGWTGGSLAGQATLGRNDAFVIKLSNE